MRNQEARGWTLVQALLTAWGSPSPFFLSFSLPPILASLAESLSKTKVNCILKNTTENNYWNLKTKQERTQSVPSAQLYDPCSPVTVQCRV